MLTYDLRLVICPVTLDTSWSSTDERPVILTAEGGALPPPALCAWRLFDACWPEGFVLGYLVEGSNTELYLFMKR